jgi:hypothetical protein
VCAAVLASGVALQSAAEMPRKERAHSGAQQQHGLVKPP